MRSADALSAKLAEFYATIEGERYLMFQMIDFEAKIEKNKSNIPILGKVGGGSRAAGADGTFSGTMYYNTSIFREMMIEYMRTGKDVYFECQITNEDPTSAAGRQTVVLLDCNLDSAILAKFDADGDVLNEEFDGTFESCNMPEVFEELRGMRS